MTSAARGPLNASCCTRRELAERFSTCARLYSEAVVRLTGVSSHDPNFQRLFEGEHEARQELETARIQYQEHVTRHGC